MGAAKGGPGVTTAAVALAAVWPRSAIVAECDPSGGDLALRLNATGVAIALREEGPSRETLQTVEILELDLELLVLFGTREDRYDVVDTHHLVEEVLVVAPQRIKPSRGEPRFGRAQLVGDRLDELLPAFVPGNLCPQLRGHVRSTPVGGEPFPSRECVLNLSGNGNQRWWQLLLEFDATRLQSIDTLAQPPRQDAEERDRLFNRLGRKRASLGPFGDVRRESVFLRQRELGDCFEPPQTSEPGRAAYDVSDCLLLDSHCFESSNLRLNLGQQRTREL